MQLFLEAHLLRVPGTISVLIKRPTIPGTISVLIKNYVFPFNFKLIAAR